MKPFYLLLLLLLCLSGYTQDDYVIDKPIEKSIEEKQIIKNPDYTNYFLTPTAFSLKKKAVRVSGTDIAFLKGSYGLMDNTTVSVNLSMFGTATGSIKQSVPFSEDLTFAVTASGGQIAMIDVDPQIDSMVFIVGASALATLGNHQNNVSFGYGAYNVYLPFELPGNKQETFLHVFLGLQYQLSKRFYLMGDLMYFHSHRFYTGSLGAKMVISNFMSAGIGVMPLAYTDPRSGQTNFLNALIPVVTFRVLLNGKMNN